VTENERFKQKLEVQFESCFDNRKIRLGKLPTKPRNLRRQTQSCASATTRMQLFTVYVDSIYSSKTSSQFWHVGTDVPGERNLAVKS